MGDPAHARVAGTPIWDRLQGYLETGPPDFELRGGLSTAKMADLLCAAPGSRARCGPLVHHRAARAQNLGPSDPEFTRL
jgi:hypothetical protein